MKIKRARLSDAIIAFLITAALLWSAFAFGPGAVIRFVRWEDSRGLLAGAKVGMSRSEVIHNLGKPINIAHARADFFATNSFKPVPTAPVEREVLEYIKGSHKIYVYIDHRGKVSKVFLART